MLTEQLRTMGIYSIGFVHVLRRNIFGSSVRQKRRVASVFSLVSFFSARSSCVHLTYKTVFHAESLRGRFLFR